MYIQYAYRVATSLQPHWVATSLPVLPPKVWVATLRALRCHGKQAPISKSLEQSNETIIV